MVLCALQCILSLLPHGRQPCTAFLLRPRSPSQALPGCSEHARGASWSLCSQHPCALPSQPPSQSFFCPSQLNQHPHHHTPVSRLVFLVARLLPDRCLLCSVPPSWSRGPWGVPWVTAAPDSTWPPVGLDFSPGLPGLHPPGLQQGHRVICTTQRRACRPPPHVQVQTPQVSGPLTAQGTYPTRWTHSQASPDGESLGIDREVQAAFWDGHSRH